MTSAKQLKYFLRANYGRHYYSLDVDPFTVRLIMALHVNSMLNCMAVYIADSPICDTICSSPVVNAQPFGHWPIPAEKGTTVICEPHGKRPKMSVL